MPSNAFSCDVPLKRRPAQENRSCVRFPATLQFHVVDSDDYPICGAVFQLRCGSENCAKFVNAMSDCNGLVRFCGLLPGSYNLVQVLSAYGFLFDDETVKVWKIRICETGIKVDGQAARDFSIVNAIDPQIPATTDAIAEGDIDDITEDTVSITGTGSPGCKVDVTFPSGQVCCVYTNKESGEFYVNVPDSEVLKENDTVGFVQTCGCNLPSSKTTKTVTAP